MSKTVPHVRYACHHCGKIASQPTGAVNRARRKGLNLYCGRKCGGLGRRSGKTKAQRVAEKSAYDLQRRNGAKRHAILAAKREAYKRDFDPKKAARYRKKRMPYHVEYCRRPQYRAWKTGYDKKHRANKYYGPFAESAIILNELKNEILTRSNHYEIATAQGNLNKKQERRREYERLANGR